MNLFYLNRSMSLSHFKSLPNNEDTPVTMFIKQPTISKGGQLPPLIQFDPGSRRCSEPFPLGSLAKVSRNQSKAYKVFSGSISEHAGEKKKIWTTLANQT